MYENKYRRHIQILFVLLRELHESTRRDVLVCPANTAAFVPRTPNISAQGA
jgi:hypothetical protein